MFLSESLVHVFHTVAGVLAIFLDVSVVWVILILSSVLLFQNKLNHCFIWLSLSEIMNYIETNKKQCDTKIGPWQLATRRSEFVTHANVREIAHQEIPKNQQFCE